MSALKETESQDPNTDGYLHGRGTAWFAFAMTFGLMLFDYIDRQVIVSLFPHIKAQWNLSDKELGGLVSVISIVVAVLGVPIALLADRMSRVRSIFIMATTWSVATISCMFSVSYAQLFLARSAVGAGEAGYGSVGAALISSLFPKRLRGAVLGSFFAAASLGSVMGVVLGGVIAAKWGWKAAFGVVGLPGLVMAFLYLWVKDYKTVALTPQLDQVTNSLGATVKHIIKTLARTRTLLWVCFGAAMQLIVVSAVWSWMPSYLNRFHGMAPDVASKQAALVVLVGALGCVVWGYVVDRLTVSQSRNKLNFLAVLCLVTLFVFLFAFAGDQTGAAQINLVLLGGFFMTCTVGVVSGIVIDVVHPGVRSTGSAVLSLFQNLFGMAIGPFLVGLLSDLWGLQQAMGLVPIFSVFAAIFFVVAGRCYDHDVSQVQDMDLGMKPSLAT